MQSEVLGQLKKVADTFTSKIEALLTDKGANNRIKAYEVVKRLKLSNTVLRAVKEALRDEFNVQDVLEFDEKRNIEGLARWCDELGGGGGGGRVAE